MKPVKFARSARRHRIGRAHALYVMENNQPERSEKVPDALVWIGRDDRGVELEVAAIDRPDHLYVIHVMPTWIREN